MALMRERGHDVVALVAVAVGDFLRKQARLRWQERIGTVHREYRLPLRRLCAPPARLRLWSESWALRTWLKMNGYLGTEFVLHCRGPVATKISLDALEGCSRARVIFDCRGFAGAEAAYIRGQSNEASLAEDAHGSSEPIDEQERDAIARSSHVMCVSRRMHEILKQVTDKTGTSFSVVPCCTEIRSLESLETQRKQTRDDLGLNGRFVVVYNGSLAAWQMPDECIQLFCRLRESIPNAHFLVLTTDTARFAEYLNGRNLSPQDYTLLSVPNADVWRFLCAGDCGLLVRERSVVNQVASPVKFAEYLAAGLPVIISEGIGDYSDLVSLYHLGWSIPDLPSRLSANQIDSIAQSLGVPSRARCRDWAEANLGWAAHIDTYSRVWSR
ncbi:MAG: hypothetical protein IPK27_04120 [Rhodanobacteraceae bacterium]|nr:hypothetical protein [Rhodanobacteraceae bacterium]